MRILLYTWGAFNMRDLEENLLLKGHEVDTFTYIFDDFEESPDCFQELTTLLKNEPYDFVMSINYFPVISDACNSCNVKYLFWTCDSPLLTLYTKSIFNPCNYLFSFDKWVYYTFKSYGCKHVYYLPLAVDTSRIEALLQKTEDVSSYKSDISFVGSLYEKNDYDLLTNLPDYLRGYLDATMQAQTLLYDHSILEDMITDDVETQFSDHAIDIKGENYFGGIPLIVATTFLGFKTTDTERRMFLNMLSKKHKVDLYTRSDSSDLILVNNKGPVDYQTQMPLVFHNSKINLNITVRTIRTGLSLRIFDILGAGGFLLTNYQPELDYFFENGKDLVYFTDADDMCKKADYYLTHEEERMEIARNGLQKAKSFHTYDIRLDQMFQYLKLDS